MNSLLKSDTFAPVHTGPEIMARGCAAKHSFSNWQPMEMVMHRKAVAGSLRGNLQDTQEVLDYCATHGIGPDIPLIQADESNEAYDRGGKKARCAFVTSSIWRRSTRPADDGPSNQWQEP